MKTKRLFEIIYILLNKKIVTASYLAGRFGVSQRTVYRDIDALTLAGIPVYTEKGKGGGISLLPEYVLNKSMLDEKEQSEILSAIQSLSIVKAVDADELLNKLSAIFNRSVVNWLEIDFSSWGQNDSKIFSDLRTAILSRKVTEFDYFSTFGEETRRRIEPLQLWFKARAWYVKGFCLTRQDLRVFKLTRIRNLTVTNTPFSETRDLLDIVPAAEPDAHRKLDVKLRFKIAPEMAYRVFDEFDGDDVEKQEDGSFIVTVTWPEDDWVYGTILSYGEYLEILEPQHIKKIIREKLQKTIKKYL